MSFDYLDDLFGKERPTTPRYAAVEQEAIRLLIRLHRGQISYDAFCDGFTAVQQQLIELDDHMVRAGDPLWLNQLIGFHFIKWRKWHYLRRMHREHPEQFNTPELDAQYREIEQMNFDGQWMERCRRCLEELSHKMPAANEEQAENDSHA